MLSLDEKLFRKSNVTYLEGIKELYGFQRVDKAISIFNSLPTSSFIELCRRHKMIGHVQRALQESSNGFHHTKALMEAFKEQVKRSHFLIYEQNRIRQLFKERGVPCLFFKGAILSQKLYNEPNVRYTWDTDIFVEPSKVLEAYCLLKELNYSYTGDDPFTNLDHLIEYCNLYKNIELYHPSLGFCVELHWSLLSQNVCSMDIQEPFRDAQETLFNGDTYLTLNNTKEFIYLVMHAFLHKWFRYQLIHDIYTLMHVQKEYIDKVSHHFYKIGYGIVWEQTLSTINQWYPHMNLSYKRSLQVRYINYIATSSLIRSSLISDSVYEKYKRFITEVVLSGIAVNMKKELINLFYMFLQTVYIVIAQKKWNASFLKPFLKAILIFRPKRSKVFHL